MKKINVNQEACIGCGACVAIDPEHFEFNDEGLSHPIKQENLDATELHSAIDSCPTGAISIEDGDEVLDGTAEDKCECDDECECEEEDCKHCCHHEEN